MSPLRRSPLPESDDAGTSLVELLVVMLLVGVLGGIVLTTFTQGMTTMRSAEGRSTDTQSARTAVDAMSRTLRMAVDPDGEGALPTFVSAGPSQVQFYSNIHTRTAGLYDPPALVTFTLTAAGDLEEQVVPGRWSTTLPRVPEWTLAPRTRVLARGAVAEPAASPRDLFTYLQPTDTALRPDGTTISSLAVDAERRLTTEAAQSVSAVEVWVSLNGTAGREERAVTLTSRVNLPNARSATP